MPLTRVIDLIGRNTHLGEFLPQLRAAILPNVRQIVPHDHTNLYLIDEQRRLGPFVIDPTALAWPDRRRKVDA